MGSCAHKVITIYTLRLKNGSQGDHYLYNEVEKSHKAEKVTKKKINNYNHEEKSCKVSKKKIGTKLYELRSQDTQGKCWWTDGQTDERMNIRTMDDGWVRVLCPFNSISVISRRWKGEHERLYAMNRRFSSGRNSPPAGFEPATPWTEVGSANRLATQTLLTYEPTGTCMPKSPMLKQVRQKPLTRTKSAPQFHKKYRFSHVIFGHWKTKRVIVSLVLCTQGWFTNQLRAIPKLTRLAWEAPECFIAGCGDWNLWVRCPEKIQTDGWRGSLDTGNYLIVG